MTKLNPLFLNDVYKHGHAYFYNPKTTKIYSTFTPRKSRVNGVDKVVVFIDGKLVRETSLAEIRNRLTQV